MGKPFFTKKQKAQMRERRKKKKLAQNPNKNDVADSKEQETQPPLDEQVQNVEPGSKKRSRDESSENVNEVQDQAPALQSENDHKKRRVERNLVTKIVQGKLHVLVPSNLSAKDQKKFRKDARRQLRAKGELKDDDDDTVEFVLTSPDELEHEPSSGGKDSRNKKKFPSIKELMQQKKVLDQLKKEEDKRAQKLQQIPDDVKAQYVALDCEMVGIGTDGKKSALARVSLVDWNFNVVLDSFVKVPIRVTDFRTHVSGVEPKHIKDKTAMEVDRCRELVASLLKDKILVGHALTNDLKALLLTHPKSKIRDTAKYRPFQRFGNGKWRARKLRDLVKENLKGKEGFQEGEHDSVDDAKASMELFQLVQSQWEKELASKLK